MQDRWLDSKINNNFKKMNKKIFLQAANEQQPNRVYKIDLTNKALTCIVPVKQFDKLRYLNLSYNNITRIENVNCYPDLRQLHLQSNSLQKLGGVEGNKALQVLNLRHNNIEKIQNIGHLIKLETLVLDHNQVSKIAGLEYLKDLKHLYVSHNRIESVENLPAFSKLQNLKLSHNKIRNIPVGLFNASKNMVFLDLSHNRIENTAFMQNVTSLESLNLSHNKIKQLQVNIMPNLESINVSHNELEILPIVGTVFPEVVSINISHNMICSELQILTSLSEAEYLTEFDFRENPMMSESFELGLQKIHNFDFLNGKTMTKAGAKYYDKIHKIQEDLNENSVLYGDDDEEDRKIKMSGFFDDDLEYKMTGTKVNRPSSPGRKNKMLEKQSFYDDIDKTYHEFMENDRRIKVIRQHYLKICGNYDIKGSEHILTELPPDSMETVAKQASYQEKAKQQEKKEGSSHFITSQNELRKENQKNLNKWKELKQREKSFNIREVIKKSRGKDSSMNRGINSSTGSNWGTSTGFKADKIKSQLLRTQAVPRKTGDDLLRAIVRPKSVRKKE